jgi:hypothetical protein
MVSRNGALAKTLSLLRGGFGKLLRASIAENGGLVMPLELG